LFSFNHCYSRGLDYWAFYQKSKGLVIAGNYQMIKKTRKGYIVKSESGKNLSKPNLSKPAAENRLAQIEYFKYIKKK